MPPFVPGIVPGTKGVCPGTDWASIVQNKTDKEKTRVCPWDKAGLSQGQVRFVFGTMPGSSQGQPDQKVYVYVPFSLPEVTLDPAQTCLQKIPCSLEHQLACRI